MPFDVRPVLASLADASLRDPEFMYEPKYDGIRAIVEIAPKGHVRLWSRLGNDKTRQFPEIAAALERWARARGEPLVLGRRGRESIAVSASAGSTGRGTQKLQSTPDPSRTALIAFDILRDGRTDFRDRPLVERRAALEQVFGRTGSPVLRISDQVSGDGRALYKQALDRGWEGLIAKHARSLYKSGKRSPDWRKLKIVHEQELVIGGWTEPRQTRAYFGALLLGVYEGHDLVYTGHTGTGFSENELARVMKRLEPLETNTCPFKTTPKTNEHPHWVRPELVAQITFTEWTADAKLRHPVHLGLRDDRKAAEVRREEKPRVQGCSTSAEQRVPSTENIIAQLDELEHARKDGVVTLPDGDQLKVTNLHKVFWPKQKLTKGDLLRYYARVAPFVLPAVADRPLVMKRFPNGIAAPPFYQHRAPEAPPGVRTEVVSLVQQRPQIVGGSMKTLLYMAQLAAISQDPWFSRVAHPALADCAGVSTPVTWQEIDEGFDRTDFTIETAPARFQTVGDLWAKLRKSKGVDLAKVTRYANKV